MTQFCPSCGDPIVPPRGDKDSPVLIIGEFPGESEMENGKPFSGPAGGVLRTELARAGIDMPMVRIMNLWLHPKPTSRSRGTTAERNSAKARYENCYKAGYNLVLEEAKKRNAILLVGSDAVNAFTKYSVSDVNGLRLDKKDHLLSAPIVMCSPNPAIVFHAKPLCINSYPAGLVCLGRQAFYDLKIFFSESLHSSGVSHVSLGMTRWQMRTCSLMTLLAN